MMNSPGDDGQEYTLLFKPSVSGFSSKKHLAAFELPFRFYNGEEGVLTGLHLHTSLLTVEDGSDDRFGLLLPADVENQKQMSELTKKKRERTQINKIRNERG